jgi:alkylated DNA repair dioxygenase AlkB
LLQEIKLPWPLAMNESAGKWEQKSGSGHNVWFMKTFFRPAELESLTDWRNLPIFEEKHRAYGDQKATAFVSNSSAAYMYNGLPGGPMTALLPDHNTHAKMIMGLAAEISEHSKGLVPDYWDGLPLSAANINAYQKNGLIGRHRDKEKEHKDPWIASTSPIGHATFTIERRYSSNIVIDLGPGDVLLFHRDDYHWVGSPRGANE